MFSLYLHDFVKFNVKTEIAFSMIKSPNIVERSVDIALPISEVNPDFRHPSQNQSHKRQFLWNFEPYLHLGWH